MKIAGFLQRVLFILALVPLTTSGVLQREANTTLQLPASPPVFGYTSANAFGTLTFTNPVAMATPSGETNRLFVVEKRGRIIVITNLAAPNRTVFMDITSRVATTDSISEERGLLGLAFHPDYANNGYFYVFYTSTGTAQDRLSRFQRSPSNPAAGLAASELILIAQADEAGNHNAGDLLFGPDGYLYVSLGDEGGGNDQYNNSQRINKDFFSGILRIDVDKRPGNLLPNPHASSTTNYWVPADNPFVGATNFNGLPVNSNSVRTEFWAVGLRNPWRMSFDLVTGALYCGDVGQGTREEIDIIVKGANYGWNYWEGVFQRTNSSQIPAGFVHTRPLIDYPRTLGFSVTGGRVYRGQRLSQLHGAYLYADYDSGRLWALRHTGTNVTQNTVIMTDAGISAFGVDPRNGDILYADLANATDATIDRINYNSSPVGPPLPATLADTGAFSDLAALAPHRGIVPYDLNVPFWSDNAIKTRWVSVPNTNLTIGFSNEGNWSFPTGTVWVKHFELELTNGVASSMKRLETRFIVKNTNGVYGVTYRWGNSLTNATLVPEEGLDETFVIDQGGGNLRTQVWHYPSRTECLTCHTPSGGFALGFNTAQLNRDYDYGGGDVTNQIAALQRAGYFQNPVTNFYRLPQLAHPTNASWSLGHRVRSYLAANCVQCHHPAGSALGSFDTRIFIPTSQANLIDGALVNNFGDTNNRVIVRNSPANSMLLTRIATLGTGRMPPLDSNLLDTQAIALVTAWINELTNYQTFPEWQLAYFGSTNAPNSASTADPDTDGANNLHEYLTKTDPQQAAEVWRLSAERITNAAAIVYTHLAGMGFDLQWTTNLFGSNAWQSINDPQNRPFFSRTNMQKTVTQDVTQAPQTFYRMRIYEP